MFRSSYHVGLGQALKGHEDEEEVQRGVRLHPQGQLRVELFSILTLETKQMKLKQTFSGNSKSALNFQKWFCSDFFICWWLDVGEID